MVRNIVRLLSEKQRRRGVWVVFSVLARAILDFAGIAALVPILLIVVKQDGGRSMRCRITVCIAKEHLSYASGTCTKLLSVGNISGV